MKSKARFYVHGYYGNENLGDEAILTVLVENLKRIWPDCEISIVSADDKSPQRVGVQRVLNKSESIRSSDVVIIGGGGMFDDAGPRGWRDQAPMFKEILYAKWLRKKVVFFAVGVGPYRSIIGKTVLALEGRLANLITVRDQESFDFLCRYRVPKKKIHLTGDLAFLLRDATPEEIEPSVLEALSQIEAFPQPRIGVNLFSLSTLVSKKPEVDRERREILAGALDGVMDKLGGSTIFVSAQGMKDGKDFLEADKTIALMKNKDQCLNVPYFENPPIFKEVVKKLDCLIGMKLHSLMFGFMAGVPILGLSYHPKVSSFMKMIGASNFCISIQGLSSEVLTTLIQKAVSGEGQSKESQREQWEKIREGAQLNFEMLKELVLRMAT